MMDKTVNHVPTVSIGMPVYNGEKYITEALCSLLYQNFTDFELIISDNCSTDKTQEICQKFASKDFRVRYIRQIKNIGAGANFEFVLNEAKCDFFMWLACDDYLESNNYLSAMIDTIQKGYDFCFPNVKLKDESAKEKIISEGVMDRFSSCKSTYDYSKQTVYTCSYQIYGLFRRNLLIKHFKYIDQCKDLRCYNEGLFVHAITANALPRYVPLASLIYRRHADNISLTQKKGHLVTDFVKFTNILLSFYFMCKKFTITQKIIISKNILFLHIKHLLILVFPRLLKLKNIGNK